MSCRTIAINCHAKGLYVTMIRLAAVACCRVIPPRMQVKTSLWASS